MIFDKRTARQLTRSRKRKVDCHICGEVFEMRVMLGHFEKSHSYFNFNLKCFLCGKTFMIGHLEKCIQNLVRLRLPKYQVDFVPAVRTENIKTEPGRRAEETIQGMEQEHYVPNRSLPDAATYFVTSKVRFTKSDVAHCVTYSSPSNKKEKLFPQRSHDETFLLATQVILAYEPDRWFHLMISKHLVDDFRRLVRDRTDVFIPDFYCWCCSRQILGELVPEHAEHVHLLLYSDSDAWITEVWNKLVSKDSNAKYKLMKRINDPVHLTKALLYCSQTRPCATYGRKHYNIHRPINNEFLLWLTNPVMVLDDIYDYMQSRVDPSRFDLYRKGKLFTTPLHQITRQLEHFTKPIATGRLVIVDDIVETDVTLTWTPDGKFINLLPGNDVVTMADVLDAVFPGEHYVWHRNRHRIVESTMLYHERMLQELSNDGGSNKTENNRLRRAKKRIEKYSVSSASIDMITTGPDPDQHEIIQIAIYMSNGACFNWYMVPTVAILPEAQCMYGFHVQDGQLYKNQDYKTTVEKDVCREAVIMTLKFVMGGQLGAKNGDSLNFPMLKRFVGYEVLKGIQLVDTEQILRDKFPGCHRIEDYAAAVSYTKPLHDAVNNAELHQILWNYH